MKQIPDVSVLAKILSDQSRMLIMDLLMDGKAHTVSELAKAASIEPHTTSYHLRKLEELNWVTMEKHGRFHYFRLSNCDIADIFEYWSNFSPAKPIQYLSQTEQYKKLYKGRTCYDHLAGKIGVTITNYLLNKGYLISHDTTYHLSQLGERFFISEIGLNLDDLKQEKRAFCRMCLDWSERRHHLAGSLGKGLTIFLIENKYLVKDSKSRAISLTRIGEKYFREKWNLALEAGTKQS